MSSDDADLSLPEAFDAPCPLCGAVFEACVWRVVDADRRPDLVVRACDGSLNRCHCPRCIGPGVERPGAFVVARRAAGRLGHFSFFAPSTSDFQAEDEALFAQLRQRCRECGIADDALEPLGSSWVQATRDIADRIADLWPDLKLSVDPSMLAGPLPTLLNAGSPAQRGAALRACPDLARPNIERFLGRLGEQGEPRLRVDAMLALYFVAMARGRGLDEAVRHAEATETRVARRRQLPTALGGRLTAFLERSPGADVELVPLTEEANALAQALQQAGLPGFAADVWAHVGFLLRVHPDPAGPEAMSLAAMAYGVALKSLEPERVDMAWAILMGLAATWDLRSDGVRSDNLERALEFASAAREQARSLPVDSQAEAAMELGILCTHRIVGDPDDNLAFAREAHQFAVAQALDAGLRAMASFNLALVDVEDPAEGPPLDRGIAMLQALSHPQALQAWFDESQQQNLFQSLAVALARRATGRPDGDPGDLDRAAGFMDRALDIARARGAHRDAAGLAGLLARIEADRRLHGRGDRDLAQIVGLLDEAGATLGLEQAPYEYARNELRRAGVLRDLGDPRFVGTLVRQALGNACRVLTPDTAPDLCRRAQAELARWHLRADDLAAAADAYATACDASERVYAGTETVARREQEALPNAELYEGLVDTLEQQARAGATRAGADDAAWRVLEAMEAGRARLTLDLLGRRPLPPFAGVPEALRERESRLIAELGWQLPERAPMRAAEDAERVRLRRARQAALEQLWQDIERCGPGGRRHVALRRSRPSTRQAMQAGVAAWGERAAIASFFVLQDRLLVAWLRAGQAPRIHMVAVGAQALRDTWLAAFERDVLAEPPAATPAHAWLALGEMLFAPVADELAGLELLVLVPHRDLHALPLHALQVRGRPLIEQVPVLYGPSIGVLLAIGEAERGDTRRGAALVASHATDPAEVASFEGEADAVAQRLGTRALHHATRCAVLQAAPAAGIVHLVGHGVFVAADPLDSGVLLADGVLRARDWLPLELGCDLVTLSACDTGRQQVHAGDELAGLARTLLQAGAAGVLLTLWRVDSAATADWMAAFYAALAVRSRATAFQHACRELRARDPDPRGWAPFILMGDAGGGDAAVLAPHSQADRPPRPPGPPSA